jgi:site-specific recombinase XerD
MTGVAELIEITDEGQSMPLTITPAPGPALLLEPFAPRVQEYVRASRSKNTLRGYRSDWAHFTGWCGAVGLIPLPALAETVAAYITTVADSGLKAGSIQRRISAIAAHHSAHGYDSPTGKAAVTLTLAGIRRKIGTHQEGKAPVLTADIAAMVSRIPETTTGKRDRAIILLGFAGALRRSELVAIDVEDITFEPDGIRLNIRKSKTDQDGSGQVIGIANGRALCPVRALRAWLESSDITGGPVFRRVRGQGRVQPTRLTDQVVASVVKRCAASAGLDPAKYAGHSLRAGLVTQAAINGVQELAIMKQTRHKSSDMLRKYIRDANVFRDNASARVGL